jgi:hypothetical protein
MIRNRPCQMPHRSSSSFKSQSSRSSRNGPMRRWRLDRAGEKAQALHHRNIVEARLDMALSEREIKMKLAEAGAGSPKRKNESKSRSSGIGVVFFFRNFVRKVENAIVGAFPQQPPGSRRFSAKRGEIANSIQCSFIYHIHF